LEAAVAAAGLSERAQAHYELALFHDNNSREAEAIPHYRAALAAGLPPARRAEALAWLASSLMKTGAPDKALKLAAEARALTQEDPLREFLDGLDRRIAHRLRSAD
jgi:tetratricopeptide (TPR) repeat protein